ncbi:MAG TPA: HAD hydrolase-like protein [Spirochaetota bacterium]|nr:HAD hydrolase-like protein [Spirochaetota bacterium]HOL55966.1 HAD hydrolase-like protein [Spirochaetota bacterium]HPP03580.1 HAD hydrolase-like protein [Spirochaetota bacterium]
MKFKCLIIDHDDTAVNSTPFLHYPAYIEAMKILRPKHNILSLEEYFIKNFDPGLSNFFRNELNMNEEELIVEYNIWREFIKNRMPEFFDGFIDLLKEFKGKGGTIVVASHSDRDIIERDYRRVSFMPDLIFGWDKDEKKRKPSEYIVLEVIEKFKISPEEILIIDDLKSGLIMAKNSNVKFGAALWAHNISKIIEYMKKESNYFFKSIEDLKEIIF